MSGPRILLYDVEMSYNVSYHYDQWGINIPWTHIKHRQFMVSAAWQWYHQKKISSVSVLDDPDRFEKDFRDDYHVIKTLSGVIEQADAVIAYNGKKFDNKEFNTGLVKHNLPPAHEYVVIDPITIARSKFRFKGGNSLANLCDFFGLKERKTDIDHHVWIAATEGCPKAIKNIVDYNKHDIPPMRRVWDILKPFAPAQLNMNHFVTGVEVCPCCASPNLKRNGKKYTRVTARQQWKCLDCGHQFLEKKTIKTVNMR